MDLDMITLTWIGIAVSSLSILFTLFLYALYCGLLTPIKISTGKPMVSNFTFAYKFARGPYKDCGSLFTESCSLAPDLHCVGVYYDDPKKVAPEKLRYAVGSILAEGNEQPDPAMIKLFTDNEYKVFTFPAAKTVFSTTFPYRGRLSVIFGVFRVYPALGAYAEDAHLRPSPWLEIYKYGDEIYYMAVLDKDETGGFVQDFFVPEATAAALQDKLDEEKQALAKEDDKNK